MNKLTIGADPEIVLVNPLTGKYISAQEVINAGTSEPFGLDGNPTTIEIRPDYADNPLELVDNIDRLLRKASKDFPQAFRLDMKPSNTSVIVGGHLHFGHNLLMKTSMRSLTAEALDTLLAPLMAMVENTQDRQARINSSYGKLYDWRPAEWGLEYRTPASWIANRKLAEAVCCLGYSIVKQAIENPDIMNNFISIPHSELKTIYDKNCIETLRLLLPEIIKTIEFIPTEYHHQINYLINSAKAGKCLLDTEIKHGWHIKFITLATMKLSDLKRLIYKLGQAMAVPNDNQSAEWVRTGNDFRVGTIATNVSTAIDKIIGRELLTLLPNVYKPTIRGKNKKYGNMLTLYTQLPDHQKPQLIKLITELCKQFEYPIPTIETFTGNDIYLPRAMRERQDYLSEAVCLVVWLYCNREVYKSKTKTKTGKEIYLPFGLHNSIDPLVQSIKKLTRPTVPSSPDFMDDGGEIMIDKLLDYCHQSILPRIIECHSHNTRLRLPANLRNTIDTVRCSMTYGGGDCEECGDISEGRLTENRCKKHFIKMLLNFTFN